MSGTAHIPVLRDEVVDALKIADGKTFLDGTFGAGGYTRAASLLKGASAHSA